MVHDILKMVFVTNICVFKGIMIQTFHSGLISPTVLSLSREFSHEERSWDLQLWDL